MKLNLLGHIYENYEHVKREFKNDKRVEIIKDYSENAVNLFREYSLDFVYIDANHSYKYVYQDLELWSSKVKSGGIIAGHDVFLKRTNSYEVLNAVKDFCYRNNINFHIEPPDWYFVK
ncbi:hypothetical protein LCGC14_2476930 [marine sediment metagenome]|uniref:Class I SAM-dependent methyltransferase n=1 Tax=marine sediment metagenome TaxID=412755 RepID=A0A0F9BWN1_9ZZZZ